MGGTRVFSLLGVSAVLVACAVPSIGGDLAGSSNDATVTPTKPKTTSTTCRPKGEEGLKPTDPNTLPKCACAQGGQARCIAASKIGDLASQLAECDAGGSAGACVPDDLVASGGAAPKKCTSIAGEGRCADLCLPEVAKNAGLLNRGLNNAECTESQRCAPCVNPLNGQRTGVCEIGEASTNTEECDDDPTTKPDTTPPPSSSGGLPSVSCPYTGPPVVDVTTFESCGDGARCVPETLVGPMAAQLDSCTIASQPGTAGRCAPEKSIAAAGQYLPATCSSVAGREGRCLNVAIPAVKSSLSGLTALPQSTCDANERCAPCYNPLDGKPTGACNSVTCDAPKQAAQSFTDCCKDNNAFRGKCLPKTAIPASQQSNLDDDKCDNASLCVPNEFLDPAYKFPKCSASAIGLGNYQGVCLSDCLKFGLAGLVLPKATCGDGFKCAPCTRNGQPTGAPGCDQK